MYGRWTFGRKLTLGILSVAALTVAASVVAIASLEVVIREKDHVIVTDWQRRLRVEEMRLVREKRAKAVRSYLISKDSKFLREIATQRDAIVQLGRRLHESSIDSEERNLVDTALAFNADMQAAWDALVAERQAGAPLDTLVDRFDKGQEIVKSLEQALSALAAWEDKYVARRAADASRTASHATTALGITALVAVGLALGIAALLARNLARRIGDAVLEVKGSSTELQSSAAQQASSSQELATSTSEISTTIRELLATSRQIADGAKRVVQIASETSTVAAQGDHTGKRAHEAIGAIRVQVDVIVGHMVDLGRKSQQIGAILDLINELAEQTNILSINATIEAVGAGDAGRRFAVVADEIRRLADRVATSAREIRGLVEEIRAAANTTVMATEDGRKAVDTGSRQFADVLSSFEEINRRVSVTNDAAREIELSTRQQASAVEQVNVAISGVAGAAKETEASTRQTLATAAQLALVSNRLDALVRPQS